MDVQFIFVFCSSANTSIFIFVTVQRCLAMMTAGPTLDCMLVKFLIAPVPVTLKTSSVDTGGIQDRTIEMLVYISVI